MPRRRALPTPKSHEPAHDARTAHDYVGELESLAGIGSWQWEVGPDRITWSDQLYRIYGYVPGTVELSFSTFLDRIHPDDLERLKALVGSALETREPYVVEHRIVLPDKSVRWLQGRGFVESGNDGSPVRLFGTAQDITDRKAAEDQLRNAHDHLETRVHERTLELERTAEALREEIERRRRLEAHQSILADTAGLLAISLDYESTLDQVARLLVPRLADWSTIYVMDGDGTAIRRVLAHADSARLDLVRQIVERFPSDPQADTGPYAVIRTGTPELYAEISDEMMSRFARSPDHLDLMRQSGLRSVIWAPLSVQGRTYGALSLVSAESGRKYDDEDLTLAAELGRRCGTAIHLARVHAAEQRARESAERATTRRTVQYEVNRIITDARSVDDAVPAILQAAGAPLDWDAGALWVVDRAGEVLRCQASWQRSNSSLASFPEATSVTSFRRAQGIVGAVWADLVPQWLDDVSAAPGFLRAHEAVEAGLHSAVFVPTTAGESANGVLEFLSRRNLPKNEEILDLLVNIGHQIGEFIERRWASDLIRELSTPVLPIADRLLLMPLVGAMDPQRAAQLTDRLLQAIRKHRAAAVVIDVTGVAFMDTFVADRLIHAVEASRLLGVRVFITGLSAEVCRTLVDLRVDLSSLQTPGDLQSGIELAEAAIAGIESLTDSRLASAPAFRPRELPGA